jgi:hypothetical protein
MQAAVGDGVGTLCASQFFGTERETKRTPQATTGEERRLIVIIFGSEGDSAVSTRWESASVDEDGMVSADDKEQNTPL